MKKNGKIILGALAVLLLACLMITPAAADGYKYDGYELETVENGTIWGDVYASYGTNAGLFGTSYQTNNFSTEYTLPVGDVEWAKLYTAVWGGKEYRTGDVHSLIGTSHASASDLGTDLLDYTNQGPHATCVGNGVWALEYDVTNKVTANGGKISAFVDTQNTTDSAGIKFDGRIYGAALVIAYKNCSEDATAYWINDGILNLNYKTRNYDNKTNFDGTLDTTGLTLDEAKLTLGFYAGTFEEPDYAYFNVPNSVNTPYTLGNMNWSIDSFRNTQLDKDNVADEMGHTKNYFDLKSFTVANSSQALKNVILDDAENYLVYKLGYDNNSNGKIDTGYYAPSPKEGESYYTPFLAVLTVNDIGCTYDFSNSTLGTAGTDLFAYESDDFDGNLTVVDGVNTVIDLYSDIEADDSNYEETIAPFIGDRPAQRFVFDVSENCETCADKLKLKWIGKGFDSSAGVTIYLWNYGTSTYDEIASTDVSTETTVVEEMPVNGYMNNNGEFNVLVVQNGYTGDEEEGGTISTIQTDYIRLQLCPNLD